MYYVFSMPWIFSQQPKIHQAKCSSPSPADTKVDDYKPVAMTPSFQLDDVDKKNNKKKTRQLVRLGFRLYIKFCVEAMEFREELPSLYLLKTPCQKTLYEGCFYKIWKWGRKRKTLVSWKIYSSGQKSGHLICAWMYFFTLGFLYPHHSSTNIQWSFKNKVEKM